MLFALYALDNDGALAIRKENRQRHLDYIARTGCVKLAGPLLDDDGESMIGSLIVLEADDLPAAHAWADGDPYAKAGLFQSVRIRPWIWAVNAP